MKEQFIEIIHSEDLKDISIDLFEKAIDNQISDQLFRELPIIKSLVAVRNIY